MEEEYQDSNWPTQVHLENSCYNGVYIISEYFDYKQGSAVADKRARWLHHGEHAANK